MLLKEVKYIFHQELDAVYGTNEVASFFYLLIAHFFQMERFVLSLEPNLIINKKQESQIFKALADLRLHRPIQHIIGTQDFLGLAYQVNEHVLIPRPETEELVQWILDDCKNRKSNLSILDIGTGTGCIPIALAKQLPNAKIKAIDISKEALAVAQQNASAHKVRVDFIKADILHLSNSTNNGLPKTFTTSSDSQSSIAIDMEHKLDVIVSNPPYVRDLEKEMMHNNVLKYEPSIALFVPDKDPLLFYDAILTYATSQLKTQGTLYLEINQYLSDEMLSLVKSYHFTEIEVRKDMFGKDRMLKAIKG